MMTGFIRLPSGQLLSAQTVATAAALAEVPEPERVTKLLGRIQPLLAAELRALRKLPAKKGYAAPRDWADTTFFLLARGVLDGQLACEAAGLPLTSLSDFTSKSAVDAIVNRYSGPGKPGRNAARILGGLCTVVRRGGTVVPSYMRRARRKLARAPRRTESKDLPALAECLAAALAAFEEAVMLISDGHRRRGKTRRRDAVILAVEMLTNFRRSEFGAITADVVIFSDHRAEVKIIIPEEASKVREIQLGVIRNEAVIAMLRQLADETNTGSLFETNRKTPLAPADAYRALRRTSKRSIGIELSFNEARRIAVTSEQNLSAMRARARHRRGSNVAEDCYSWHADDLGIEQCRDALRKFGVRDG